MMSPDTGNFQERSRLTSGFYFGHRVKYQKRNPDRGLKVSYTTQTNTCINVQRSKHIFTFFYIELNFWTC